MRSAVVVLAAASFAAAASAKAPPRDATDCTLLADPTELRLCLDAAQRNRLAANAQQGGGTLDGFAPGYRNLDIVVDGTAATTGAVANRIVPGRRRGGPEPRAQMP